eukprot:11184297-Lingulodinium_polyedra.AAC.1
MRSTSKPVLHHPINDIVGWTAWHYMVDWLHTVDLGIASHACANVLFNIIYDKMAHMSRATACARVVSRLLTHQSEHGTGFDRLDLHNITEPARPHKVYPCMRHLKAAQVRNLVPKLAATFREFAGPSAYDAFQMEMMSALAKIYDIMHSAGVVLSASEFSSFRKAAFTFLEAYVALAEEAKQ